jgi:hypothetical protein
MVTGAIPQISLYGYALGSESTLFICLPTAPNFYNRWIEVCFIPENGLPEAPRKSINLGRIYHCEKTKLS